MDVRLTTLGILSVKVNGEERESLPGRPVAFGLLVFLALEKEVTRDRILGFFWPESTQEKARHTLSQTLYDLRRELGEEWVESKGNLVRTTSRLWVDALEFEAMAEAGRHRGAVALYCGPFLEGFHLVRTHAFEEWEERQRARLARRYRASADAFIREARGRGDLSAALKEATKWTALDPLDDGAQHYLIELLTESGSRSEALLQYERYEATLQEELGLEPLDETKELVERIKDGVVVTPLPRRAELGEGGFEVEADENRVAVDRQDESDAVTKQALPPKPMTRRDDITDRRELVIWLNQQLGESLEILRPIGRGSMADVLLARDPDLRCFVALKVISSQFASDPKARARFAREAQSAARINHPNVCSVHRVDTLADGTPFHLSPFVKGTTLAHRLKAEGRLPPQEVRRVIRAVASALAAAHKLGIIHRDVRPGNVLYEEETERVLLCDFGIAGILETVEDPEARLTFTGEIVGHHAYISPEQMFNEPLTDRSDVYSLGVMGHELLTGDHPPQGRETIQRPGGTFSPPDLSPLVDYLGATEPDLVDLVKKCLAVNPTHRPSAADITRKCEEHAQRTEASSTGDGVAVWHPVRAVFERRLPAILGAYLAGGWGAFEFTQYLVSDYNLSKVAEDLVLLSIPFGFMAVSIVGWFHGKTGKQEMTAPEKWLLAVVGVGWLVGVGLVVGMGGSGATP